MKPVAYGYLRPDESVLDTDIAQMELVLQDYAKREGYCLAEIFYEENDDAARSFAALIEQLKRQEAHHVLTPTLDHISDHPALRRIMLHQLAEEAGARVITLTAPVEGTLHVRDRSHAHHHRHIPS